jgi:hypothetical protein
MQTPLPARRPLASKLACAAAAPSARAELFRGAVTLHGKRPKILPLLRKGRTLSQKCLAT